MFTDPLNVKKTGPSNHIVLDTENGQGSAFDTWWRGYPRYFVLSQGFKFTGHLYPPFSMFPQPQLSNVPAILLGIGPCRDEFDEKYGSGYCSSRGIAHCSEAGFKKNCLKTCKGCMDGDRTTRAVSVSLTPKCENELDSKYGKGYCEARKGICQRDAGFRQQCKMTCRVCAPNPTAAPAQLNTSKIKIPTHSPTRPKSTDQCASTQVINTNCPKHDPSTILPDSCNPSCAKTFMGWYGNCVNDPRISAINTQLHDGLHAFFLLCQKSLQN